MPISHEIKTEIREAVKPTRFLDYKHYLKAVYKDAKGRLKRYSYLQFAEDLGFSRTNVIHLIIQGKRPLSGKAAAKIIKNLGLSGLEKNYLETLVAYQNERESTKREEVFKKLVAMKSRVLTSDSDKAQLEFFSEWYHPAIYEMTRLDDFKSDAKWIADQLQLRIRPEQARKSLQLLETLNLIRYDEDLERHIPTDLAVSTGDEISSVAIVRYHQKMIDMGKDSITRVKTKKRDISAVTVSVSEDVAEQMKREIQVFRKKLMALADESEERDVIYQMNIQLFPLTKED